jgi:CRP-like cAMP-binding protein
MLTTVEKMLFLHGVDIFKDIPLDNLMTIAGIAREESYAKNTVLFEEGEEGDSLYLIVEGRVGVKKKGNEDEELIAVLGASQCVGEMAILSDEPRSATVETMEDTSLLVINKNSFKTLIRKNPEIAFHIFNILVHRMRSSYKHSELKKGDDVER